MTAKDSLTLLESRRLDSLVATEELAKEIVLRLKPQQIIGLQGEMGIGKTYFIKALAQQLGCPSIEVNSPSYAIHQEYHGTTKKLQHVDLYRLESEDEIESSGFWDLFDGSPDSLIVIEWIDRINLTTIPQNYSYLRMEWERSKDDARLVHLYLR